MGIIYTMLRYALLHLGGLILQVGTWTYFRDLLFVGGDSSLMKP